MTEEPSAPSFDLDSLQAFVASVPAYDLSRIAFKAFRRSSLRVALGGAQDAYELYLAAYCAVRLAEIAMGGAVS